LGAGSMVHAWLDRAPRVVATPLAFPEPAPVVLEARAELAPIELVPEPVLEEPVKVVPKRAARPKRAPVEAPKREQLVAARKAPPEPELVLHEPEVLFYDEEDPAAAPRIGLPTNPF
ncbi:MAG TPA: hypothetical protein VFX59_12160, partial [Polyangiales bacterium]|nr:hypothetical protein [Polyangiales bacterium]